MSKKLESAHINSNDIAIKFDSGKLNFGIYLRKIREEKKISIRQLARAIGITPTYLSDIEKGNNKPPNKQLLEEIVNELQIKNYDQLTNTLFDLAAKERNDVPEDIKEYIMNNEKLLSIIRIVKNKPNEQQVWDKISKLIV